MQIGIIGLGRMGANIARRLMHENHQIVGYDVSPQAVKDLSGASGAHSIEDLVAKLSSPRSVWLMLPAGAITEDAVNKLSKLLAKGDVVIDGGNSFYRDDIRRSQRLAGLGIDYVDCGTSGGIFGLERGYCMMIGGKKEVVDRLDPIFQALAPGAGTISKTPNR